MNRNILSIAVPSIISNITVPLLGLVDTAIVGHLGAAAYIGAIAVGGLLFNMIYWLFGFLRMGTGGLTSQAFGADDRRAALGVLFRSLGVAGIVSFLIVLLQDPLLQLALACVEAEGEVKALSSSYYRILVWGAPAVLGLYSFVGWFLGMQNARYPMWVAVLQNVTNICASLFLVLYCGWKVEGVALGTLIAQYAGLGFAVVLWWYRYRPLWRWAAGCTFWDRVELKRFFQVNRDIFLRTLCIIAVTTCFTAVGTRLGEVQLAANAVLMQFFVVFSYVMDGFAYSAEALGGRYLGARHRESFDRLVRYLFLWGIGLAVAFSCVYYGMGDRLLFLLTSEREVTDLAVCYLPYVALLPVAGFAAFLFDGLFIGTTSTREMLVSMSVAVLLYFLLLYLLPSGNASLWVAFLAYLGSRGVMQALLWKRITGKFSVSAADGK